MIASHDTTMVAVYNADYSASLLDDGTDTRSPAEIQESLTHTLAYLRKLTAIVPCSHKPYNWGNTVDRPGRPQGSEARLWIVINTYA